MKTHNELFKLGKKIDAYILFRKQTKTKWCFIKYVSKMNFYNE